MTPAERAAALEGVEQFLTESATERRRGGIWPRVREEFALHMSVRGFIETLLAPARAERSVEAAREGFRAGVRSVARLYEKQ